jgi:hypothetical protein
MSAASLHVSWQHLAVRNIERRKSRMQPIGTAAMMIQKRTTGFWVDEDGLVATEVLLLVVLLLEFDGWLEGEVLLLVLLVVAILVAVLFRCLGIEVERTTFMRRKIMNTFILLNWTL